MTVTLNLSEIKPSIKMAMDVMDIYKNTFKSHGISCNVSLANNIISVSVEDEYDNLEECFGEALSNAQKYLEENAILRSMSIQSLNKPGISTNEE